MVIAAALPREDAGDVLVTVKGRPLPDGPFLVGTGSPRRQVQIGEMRNARCALLRGNIQTRLNKLREGGSEVGSPSGSGGIEAYGPAFRPGVLV